MKVSASVLCSAIAAVYVTAHFAFLSPSLEDIDSINFALGLRDFDIARHQPHPPGYPVYIALGRVSRAAIAAVAPALDPIRADALALAIWSAVSGAVALAASWLVFQGLARNGVSARLTHVPLWATGLLAASPLFWMTGLRPMSDMPGLASALAAQAVVLHARSSLALSGGAALAGIAAGIRVQTLWLTVPLLALRIIQLRRTWPIVAWPLACFALGVAAWGIPLLVASGGPGDYVRALASQAGEARYEMLGANPTLPRLAIGLYHTFVLAWASVPLAALTGAAAMAGAAVMLARERRAMLLLAVAFGPYAAFHVLSQHTPTVRYALPILPGIAWLAMRGVAAGGRLAPAVAALLVTMAALVAVPGGVAYAREPHPAFRAIADMMRHAGDAPAEVHAHFALRRPLQTAPPGALPFVEPPRDREWLGLVEYWRGGGTAPIWFLADPNRTDLAMIDPQARRDVVAYRWAVGDRPELGGARPLGADWYRFEEPPGWFAAEGWALTPEVGGLTQAAGTGVDRRPIDSFVRRRPDRMLAIVGARHLGTAPDAAASFSLAVDGRIVDRWRLDPSAGPNVLRVVELPAGALEGPGAYARLTITARAVPPGRPTPPVAIRQFDIQAATGLLHAFDEGWHEEEFDNATGLRWRWSSGRSVLRILPPQAVRLTLRGESPLEYVETPPRVRVVAGTRTIAELRPADDFEWILTLTADDVRDAEGRIVLETDPVYLPGPAEGTADGRRLGLRLFDIRVDPVSP